MSAGIRTYLELMRYENCLMAGFAAVIGTLIAFNILISDASGSYSPENFLLFFPFLWLIEALLMEVLIFFLKEQSVINVIYLLISQSSTH